MKQNQTRNPLKCTLVNKIFPGHVCIIHPGIFLGQALWADSIAPQAGTIASLEQFKPIRIGENLVVNYKSKQSRRHNQVDYHS